MPAPRGDVDGAHATLVDLISRLDREQGVLEDAWNLSWRIDNLRMELGQLHMRAGDVQKALEAWADPVGRRYTEEQAYTYSFYNNPYRAVQNQYSNLDRFGLYKEFLDQKRRAVWFENGNPEYDQPRIFEARYRLGDVDGALEEAWASVADPARGLALASGNRNVIYSRQEGRVDQRWPVLFRLYDEADRVDDLLARAAALVESLPNQPELKQLQRYLLERAERWDELAPLLGEELEKVPDDADANLAWAGVLAELGRDDEALVAYEKTLASFRKTLPVKQDDIVSYSSASTGPATIRFNWSGGGSALIYGTGYFSSSSNALDFQPRVTAIRRSLMALYAKVGRDEDARKLEEQELSLSPLRYGDEAAVASLLADTYAQHELFADAERMYTRALELDEKRGQRVCAAMVALGRRAGDEAKMHEWAGRLVGLLDEALDERPHNASTLIQRAEVLARDLAQYDRAREDLERALEHDPEQPSGHRALGWLELETGDPAAALASFREALHLHRVSGSWSIDADLYFGLGFALAEAEGVDAASPTLRRALALAGEDRSAEKARSLLP